MSWSALYSAADRQYGQAEQHRAEDAKKDLYDVAESGQPRLWLPGQSDHGPCAIDECTAE
jgi:hypothetical protein